MPPIFGLIPRLSQLYFRDLQINNMYSKHFVLDMIAVRDIDIIILRREIRAYIETCNSHRTRKQSNHLRVVVG